MESKNEIKNKEPLKFKKQSYENFQDHPKRPNPNNPN